MNRHDPSSITRADAAKVARRGAMRLAMLVQKSGQFIYRYDARKKPKPSPDYNMLRHCGSIWSMLDTARGEERLPAVAAAADRAISFLIERNVRPVPIEGAAGVVDGGMLKLGGNGLALLALLERHDARPDDHLIDVTRRLGRYILSEQREDNDFVHSRIYESYKERSFRSNYYTGEALFGLVRLYEATGEDVWLDAAVRSEDSLAERDYGVPEHSHWMLYALDFLSRHRPEPRYAEHAARIAARIVGEPSYRDRLMGGPMACRTEGLVAYLRLVLRTGEPPSVPTVEDVLATVRENLVLQLNYRTAKGDFYEGASNSEIRIDHIQHNISSYLHYSRLPESLAGP